MLATINPATNETIKTFEEISPEEMENKIVLAQNTFLKWKNTSFSERKALMLKAADVLRKNKDKYAEIITMEMGKPITQSNSEIEKCALVCEYYANNTEDFLNKEIIESDATESFVQFDPLGVILAVMPWNFPFWQVFRFAAPALMAGNTGLLKHASNVPMSAIAIEEVFTEAGFPEGCFITLLTAPQKVSEIIDHKYVMAATLTGSEFAGKIVAGSCAQNLKKSVLELGGSDPFIVLDDADIDNAVKTGTASRLLNSGQSCIAAKRFIVVEKVFEEFKTKFTEAMDNTKLGDPTDPATQLGPLARKDLMVSLHKQVTDSVEAGAEILCGGKPQDPDSCFYPATIITNVTPGTPGYDEELFGPVAVLIKAKDEDDALRIANDSPFGLGASVWTANMETAKKFATQINSGAVFVNGMVKSDPKLPFGGIKISGYGRELSHYGMKEFVNVKTVWIKE